MIFLSDTIQLPIMLETAWVKNKKNESEVFSYILFDDFCMLRL